MDKDIVENLRLRKLTPSDLKQILQLQQIVHDFLDDKSLCVILKVEEIEELLVDETGLTVGMFHDDKLIGFHSALIPGKRNDNLGYELNLRDDVIDLIFHLEICLIHPNYRGYALQTKMSRWLIEQLQQNERSRYLCETAAPHNYGSVKNTLAIGALIVQLKRMYGGLDRYIFFQDLKSPLKINEATKREVLLKDTNVQEQLFLEGYVGYEIIKHHGELILLVAKLENNTLPYKLEKYN